MNGAPPPSLGSSLAGLLFPHERHRAVPASPARDARALPRVTVLCRA